MVINMKSIQEIRFHIGSKEELLPDFMDDFPYIASRAELDKYVGRFVPWHWHRAVELFYIESGMLEYYTPKGKILFPAGSGGMVNSNVLHMTKTATKSATNIQLLHIFDASLLAGGQGNLIAKKYITPVVTSPQIEIIPLFPEKPVQGKILTHILDTFQFSRSEFGYELKLREALAEIWLLLFEQARPMLDEKDQRDKNNDKIKLMMIYIHEHYSERIAISELAASAFLSERECFRIFRNYLHMTPVEYMRDYRLQMSCQMLVMSEKSITEISNACGLGSSSYFGKIFREYIHCTPSEYRKKWQDNNI